MIRLRKDTPFLKWENNVVLAKVRGQNYYGIGRPFRPMTGRVQEGRLEWGKTRGEKLLQAVRDNT